MLLDAAEQLIGIQFVFAGSGTAQQPDVQDHHIASPGLDAVENVSQVIEIEVVAYGHEDIAGPRANGFRSQFSLQFQVELVHLYMARTSSAGRDVQRS